MATRAQIIQRALTRLHAGPTVPWYACEDVWQGLAQVAGVSADVCRVFNRPGVATAIDTVNGLVQRKVLTQQDAATWLRARLQAISLQIQDLDHEEEPILYARLDAQLELIMELLNDDKVSNG